MPRVVVEEYKFKPQASVNELKDIKNGHFWQDVEKYIKFKLEEQLAVLENVEELKGMFQSQGAIAVAKDILTLPDQMIEWAQDDQLLAQDNDNG